MKYVIGLNVIFYPKGTDFFTNFNFLTGPSLQKRNYNKKFVFLFQDSLSEFSIIDYMINIYNIIDNTINDY